MFWRTVLTLLTLVTTAEAQAPGRAAYEATRESIRAHEAWVKAAKDDLAKQYQEFDNAVAKIDGHTLRGELEALAVLKVLVRQLRDQGGRVERALGNYVTAMTAYQGELAESEAVFQAISGRASSRKAAQRFDDVKDMYSISAQIFAALAKRSNRRETTVERDLGTLADSSDYLKEVVTFLRYFDEDLASVPEFSAGESVEDLIAATKRFVRDFDKLRASMKVFHQKLGADTEPVRAGSTSKAGAAKR